MFYIERIVFVFFNLLIYCNFISNEKIAYDNNTYLNQTLASAIEFQKKINLNNFINNDNLLITTGSGRVRGTQFYIDDQLKEVTDPLDANKLTRVNAWLGIPFAEKPIGDLRFKRPVAVENWDRILNCSKLPNSCFQVFDTVIPDFEGVKIWNSNTQLSEDCLYLNIWTPDPIPKNSPVIVWIYGGGFASGTSTLDIYDPKILVAETGLIYVSIQYRLNIFGFLYMDHENAPGNQGLLDQQMALSWIHNNIQYFGGDSTKITLFGESAGSVSVSYHLLSSLSSNLFNNAIMESGSALADWALLKNVNALERNSQILNFMGCNGTNHQMIQCAKSIEPKIALDKADEYFYSHANHGVAQFTFLPVVDNYFLEEEPINLLNRGKFKKCPILTGANKDEGNWLFVYAFPEYRNFSTRPDFDYETFKDFLTSLYHFYPQFPSTSSKSVMQAIQYRYTNWENVDNSIKNFENFDEAAGDFHFLCPTVDFASTYALNDQDVFLYYFTQRSSIHMWPEWMGVMHGDEISFVFGEPLNPSKNYTEEEKVLTRKILKYWSNFARYDDPNKNLNSLSKTKTLSQYIEPWPKFKVIKNSTYDQHRAYLNLNSKEISIGYNLRAEYCAFWGSFLPNLVLNEYKCFRANENLLNLVDLEEIGKSSSNFIMSPNILKTFFILVIFCLLLCVL